MKKIVAITTCNGVFSLLYWDELKKRCCTKDVGEEDPFLVSLKFFFSRHDNKSDKLCRDEAEFIEEIGDYVEKLGGKVFKIYRKANHIYLIAHCLFEAIDRAKATGFPLKLCLPLLFPGNLTENGWAKDDSLYKLGLKRLKEANPELELMHPHRFKQIISEAIEESEKAELMEAVAKEYRPNQIEHFKRSLNSI